MINLPRAPPRVEFIMSLELLHHGALLRVMKDRRIDGEGAASGRRQFIAQEDARFCALSSAGSFILKVPKEERASEEENYSRAEPSAKLYWFGWSVEQ